MEQKFPYDKTSVESIVRHANLLTGRTLREVISRELPEQNNAGKGNLGILVERLFFQHFPPNDHNPDFPEAGLELKSAGVKRDSAIPGGFKAKERLVLNLINYHNLANETWDSSSLLHKSKLLLLLLYLYEERSELVDRKFVMPPLLVENLSQFQADFLQIRDDWKVIQGAVLDGRAHEISESDTRLLGACTKSSDSSKYTSQPFSDVPAKPRAFSLKQGYVTFLISSNSQEYISVFSRQSPPEKKARKPKLKLAYEPKSELIEESDKSLESISTTTSKLLEQQILLKFNDHLGKSENKLAELLKVPRDSKASKNYYRLLVNRILVDSRGVPLELIKDGIQVKTVRLEPNGKPKEHMSFPHFSYEDLYSQDWEDSDFASQIEQKFFFVVFQKDTNGLFKLTQPKFWTMPKADRDEAERVWKQAKAAIKSGKYSELPRSSQSLVAHVRPHARNKDDTLQTPQGGKEVKRCFWLHRNYVAEILLGSKNSIKFEGMNSRENLTHN